MAKELSQILFGCLTHCAVVGHFFSHYQQVLLRLLKSLESETKIIVCALYMHLKVCAQCVFPYF